MCTKASRPGSKYCSDNCGLALAQRRIYEVSFSLAKIKKFLPQLVLIFFPPAGLTL